MICVEAMRRSLTQRLTSALEHFKVLVMNRRAWHPRYRHPYGSIAVVADSAQQELYLSKAAQTEGFARGETQPGGPSICNLFVQLTSLYVPPSTLDMAPMFTQWSNPPYVLQDETAANYVGAMKA